MTVTRRVSRRPIEEKRLLQAVNKELVPAVAELIDHANELEPGLDAAETLLVEHETRIDALESASFAQTFGDGAATTFGFAHGLGTLDVLAQVYDTGTGDDATLAIMAVGYIRRVDANTVEINVTPAPGAGQFRAVFRR